MPIRDELYRHRQAVAQLHQAQARMMASLANEQTAVEMGEGHSHLLPVWGTMVDAVSGFGTLVRVVESHPMGDGDVPYPAARIAAYARLVDAVHLLSTQLVGELESMESYNSGLSRPPTPRSPAPSAPHPAVTVDSLRAALAARITRGSDA